MGQNEGLTRREFIKVTSIAGTGLCLGINLSGCTSGPDQMENFQFTPSAYLSIGTDGMVTCTIPESEMGQGVLTALSMILAEELGADWESVTAKMAHVDPVFGGQYTGGSTSVREAWGPLRLAGATAREMLIIAAAKSWGAPTTECEVQDGSVIHRASGKQVGFGELARAAAAVPIPQNPALKNPRDFSIIGKSMPSLDSKEKVLGHTRYCMDIRLPGMVFATVKHCPFFGGRLISFDDSAALKIPGVIKVLEIDSGLAVVARNSWAALQGYDELKAEWDKGPNADCSSDRLWQQFKAHSAHDGIIVRSEGNPHRVVAESEKVVSAEYRVPFQAHATLEPQCCLAHVHDGACEVWAPTQAATHASETAASTAFSAGKLFWEKVKKKLGDGGYENVKVTTTMLGGGFGRRLNNDYVKEAVQISRALQLPVQLFWTREEDTQHDFYRPASYNSLQAVLNENGHPEAWIHKIVGPSLSDFQKGSPPEDISDDRRMASGARQLPYSIPNIEVSTVVSRTPVPLGPWRSVGYSLNGFVVESFIDELAHQAGADPLQYRIDLLPDNPRMSGVLQTVRDISGWDRAATDGRHLGVAAMEAHGTQVAQVAEVRMDPKGGLAVPRVYCAVDCGIVVNPDSVKAQMEGSVAFALTAAILGQITIGGGKANQSNFHDFPLIRLDEMPQVIVEIISSEENPGGIGEPGVPPLAPAVGNAIFAATRRRRRALPFNA